MVHRRSSGFPRDAQPGQDPELSQKDVTRRPEADGGMSHRAAELVSHLVASGRIIMKLILAIIQPSKLEAVKEALNKVEVFRLTIVDVQV